MSPEKMICFSFAAAAAKLCEAFLTSWTAGSNRFRRCFYLGKSY
jgi:hypothetical protein